jgi:hypothetical protein
LVSPGSYRFRQILIDQITGGRQGDRLLLSRIVIAGIAVAKVALQKAGSSGIDRPSTHLFYQNLTILLLSKNTSGLNRTQGFCRTIKYVSMGFSYPTGRLRDLRVGCAQNPSKRTLGVYSVFVPWKSGLKGQP